MVSTLLHFKQMKLTSIILFALVIVFPTFGQTALKGNARSLIITPPLEMGYTLGGYGARMSKPAQGIHDNIMAKALVLNDGDKKFVIVSMDVLGFPPNMRPMIAGKLAGSGWKEEQILLLPSHSHTSLEMLALNDKNIFGMPAIGIFQQDLLEFVVDKLSMLILETEKQLVDIKVGTDQISIEQTNRNRRGDSAVDKELTVTRIDDTKNNPVAVLVNWTAHPTIMDEHDMWVSGGWPGYLQRELEDWIGNGVVAMYYNGAEGDQSVIAHTGGSHYEKAEYYGRKIAKNVLAVYDGITLSRPSFNFVSTEVGLPPKQPHPSFMQTGGEEYQLDEEKIQGLLEQILPSTTFITAVKIGDLMIVGAPGEMIAELGISIKQNLKDEGIEYPVIGGLANEWISYILTEDEYGQGGYETSVSFYGPSLGETIHSGMLKTARLLIE
jgi:hypothetical protein